MTQPTKDPGPIPPEPDIPGPTPDQFMYGIAVIFAVPAVLILVFLVLVWMSA